MNREDVEEYTKQARIARRKGKTERKAERRKLAYAEKRNNSGSKW